MKLFKYIRSLLKSGQLLVVSLLLFSTQGFTQNFEGTISYKVEFLNPMPNVVSAEEWNKMKAENPNMETITETIYYKKGLFLKRSNVGKNPAGLTLFITETAKIYTWKEHADTGYVSTLKPASGSVKQSDKTSLIAGIQCQRAVLTINSIKNNIYYHPDYFKTNPLDFKGFFIDNLDEITTALGCFPIRIDAKASFLHIRKIMVDFESTEPEDSVFTIPEFKTLLAKK